jgi:hypothetical protein
MFRDASAGTTASAAALKDRIGTRAGRDRSSARIRDAPRLLGDVAGGVVYVNGVLAMTRAQRRPPPDLIAHCLTKPL